MRLDEITFLTTKFVLLFWLLLVLMHLPGCLLLQQDLGGPDSAIGWSLLILDLHLQ